MSVALSVERRTLLAKGRSIVDRAKADDRELTPTELAEVEGAITRVKAIDNRPRSSVVEQLKALGPPEDPENPSGIFTAEAKAGIVYAAKTRTAYRTQVDTKAALTSGTLLPTSGTQVEPGIYAGGAFPLSSLFTQVQAEGPVVRYYRMSAGTAAVVAEGGLKPDAGVQITPVDLVLEKLACLAQFSDEMAEDAPFLVSHLQAELQTAVATAENGRILSAINGASGILTATGAAATVLDLVADAIAGQEAYSGKSPSVVIANPTVVASIRKTQASTSGVYVIDPTAPGPSTLHGVPIVSTATADATKVYVVEASGVTIYRRGPLTVEVGSNADDFAHNVQTARAEERIGTAVTRPSSITRITLS